MAWTSFLKRLDMSMELAVAGVHVGHDGVLWLAADLPRKRRCQEEEKTRARGQMSGVLWATSWFQEGAGEGLGEPRWRPQHSARHRATWMRGEKEDKPVGWAGPRPR